MNRIRVLELSLRCFALGLLGLIPVLGLVPAALSLHYFMSVRGASVKAWNVATPYLYTGLVCGGLGLIISPLLICVILYCVFLA